MKRTSTAATVFAALLAIAGSAASAQPILYTFTGLPDTANGCAWFDDNLNSNRDEGTMARQVDLLYNRVALPPDENVTVGGTATTAAGGQVVDYKLGSRTICSTIEALNGPTPEPSTSATPMPAPT
ncbi:MAG TPA: hypothetical protein VIX83_12845 [Candidatus Cybelea sp.]|jgi:hypothetical protein